MRGDAHTVKERIDIVDFLRGYLKLEKAGSNFKARCPFHNEKTPSFFISPARQSYYCFGCGKSGDIFTFFEEMEGVDFRAALTALAERAGVDLEYAPGRPKSERDRLYAALEAAAAFFEKNLERFPEAKAYIKSRGISEESSARWRLGYAPKEWRELRAHLAALGFSDGELLQVGLIKPVEGRAKEPYDTFRGRIIFPLADASGRIIAFSGRAVEKEAVPKYLNSPDTALFQKSEVLYGLDKAKEDIRKKNYAVLVEGQMDLVLSHQAGVGNTVASSGTAFTPAHLERLKRLSPRIILAFDGDAAGEKAAERSSLLALGLGMEVKVAGLPAGKDPADLAREAPESWKETLRRSRHAVEFFLDKVFEDEFDARKRGKLIEKRILPLVTLIGSSMEQAHFVSLIARKAGLREEVVWADLKKISDTLQVSDARLRSLPSAQPETEAGDTAGTVSLRDRIEARLAEVRAWRSEVGDSASEADLLDHEEAELTTRLDEIVRRERLETLTAALARAESLKDLAEAERLSQEIRVIHRELSELEGRRKLL